MGRKAMQRLRYKKLARMVFTLVVLVINLGFIKNSYGVNEKFVLISHATDSDSWWNPVKNAIKQAGKDFNVTVDYRNTSSGDLADMARLIEQAAARQYDGVIASVADFSVLKKYIRRITDKKIPLITINSSTEQQSKALGAIMNIGQPEYDAGRAAGIKAKEDGINSFLCVNHYATNPSSFERCRGFAEAINVDYRKSTIDTGQDPISIESKVRAYIRNNPDTQAVLALGPDSASPSLRALQKMDLKGKTWFATFDLSEEVARGIKEGSIKFAIDQQPYLQGYIPVAVLSTMKKDKINDASLIQTALKKNPKFQYRLSKYGLMPLYGSRNISSGPIYITKDNLEKVLKYAGQYR
jgi:simple sugar transport system substrate-binding protein